MNEFAESLFGQCHEICWTATADGIILHRTPAGHQELLGDPVSGAVIWSASDLDYDYSGGPRVSIRGIDCEGYGLEIVYYGIQGWANEANVPNSALPNSIGILVIDKNSVAPVSSAHLSQASKLQNGEANFRVPLFGKFSGLIGFRTIQLSDTYTADAVSSNTFTAFNQTIKTHNFLYGLQVGADGNLLQSEDGDWKLNVFVKAGAFFNWANQQSHLSDPGGLGQIGVSIDGGQGSFLGETGVMLTRQVTKHLAARAGYEALWITGLAQPTQQISQTDITGRTLSSIDTATPVFYHGATVGLELSW